ncbi:hypothetical protein ACQW02_07955 [Humitalea sp. 24SJ18S-53]|uniref:hypothetical protein n=1 Tax=Humitalea sp. 24SJ18S-53 TaxID=3422307 RepID=UPI003D678554
MIRTTTLAAALMLALSGVVASAQSATLVQNGNNTDIVYAPGMPATQFGGGILRGTQDGMNSMQTYMAGAFSQAPRAARLVGSGENVEVIYDTAPRG